MELYRPNGSDGTDQLWPQQLCRKSNVAYLPLLGIFHIFPHWADCHQIWFKVRFPRLNQLYQILFKSILKFRFCERSNFGFFCKNEVSIQAGTIKSNSLIAWNLWHFLIFRLFIAYNAFSMKRRHKDPNSAVIRLVDKLWRLIAHTTRLSKPQCWNCHNRYFLLQPKTIAICGHNAGLNILTDNTGNNNLYGND